MGRKQGWGRREYGRKEYGALGTPRHTILHLHPQATTFLSPPGGIYLISSFSLIPAIHMHHSGLNLGWVTVFKTTTVRVTYIQFSRFETWFRTS